MFKVGDRVLVVDEQSVKRNYRNGDIGVVHAVDSANHGYVKRDTDGLLMNVYWTEVELFVEKPKEIDWQVGQVVWDLVGGEGVVERIGQHKTRPVTVRYPDGGFNMFCRKGMSASYPGIRRLYFSEPKVTGELFPPKVFVPVLKPEQWVVCHRNSDGYTRVFEVVKEEESHVECFSGKFLKSEHRFRPLGEDINFN